MDSKTVKLKTLTLGEW